jgi:UPF0271 protein
MDARTPTIDLNADLGEGAPHDAELLPLVTSTSVSCGAHAGDPDAIRATLALARDHGVVVGAHPGYPDRDHFGRRDREMTGRDVRRLVEDQVADLVALATPIGVRVRFLKPHGALYNQAQHSPPHAEGVVEAAAALGLPLLGQPGTRLAAEAARAGVYLVHEGFLDRRYDDAGRLVPRSDPGAVLHDDDALVAQLASLLRLRFDTLCLHGDSPRAVAHGRLARDTLAGQGVRVAPFLAGGPR